MSNSAILQTLSGLNEHLSICRPKDFLAFAIRYMQVHLKFRLEYTLIANFVILNDRMKKLQTHLLRIVFIH